MGKRSKSRSKSEYSEDEEHHKSRRKSSFVFIDSDDEEANEDLSLKIVEKAMSRASNAANVAGDDDIVTTELVTPMKEEDNVEPTDDVEVVKLSESDGVDNSNSNNVVLRKLLRGPRYFDPPDKSWGACFNCGENGHSAVNCTSARRKKPCFICGSLEHEVKQCQKEIKCYVCKRFGHLCCVDYYDALLSEASCFKCGQSGHDGQECRRSRGETSSAGTPTSCFKCGEEGHFARECTNSSKAKKRTRDLSTPTKKYPSDYKTSKGFKSAPHDFGNTHKRFDNGSPTWSSKSNRRSGWMTDHPGDLPPKNGSYGWRSPSAPNKKHKIFGLTAGGQGSNTQSSKRRNKFSSGTPIKQGYSNHYPHGFSASRFGNSSSDGTRRNYNWW
uniref:CCHC-type domain-containing protein n=1 Tax=Chenopodium quinoa TaxID=63459 RepID=A0A803LXJ6_CHEQI